MSSKTLFDTYVLSEQLQSQVADASKNAHTVSESQMAANSVEMIIDHLISKHIFQPLSVSWDHKQITTHEEVRERHIKDYNTIHTIQDHYLSISVEAPCFGSDKLWLCAPDNYPVKVVEGRVIYNNASSLDGALSFNVLVISNNNADDAVRIVKEKIASMQSLIDTFIFNINSQLEISIKNLRQSLLIIISEQIERLKCHQEILSKLDIPLKRNDAAPGFLRVDLVREIIPPLKTQTQSIEYGISEDDYKYILKVVRHEGATHERLAKTFSKFGEEELRDMFLAHLNGHYLGSVTGETFRGSGKTDILIEFENRAAFVAEMKIWKGESELHKAIDQLTKYTTWRDCKCSLVLYNKSVKGFCDLRAKMINMLKNHARYLRLIEQKNGNEWKISCKSVEDENRHIIVHVFLFNLQNNCTQAQ